MSLQAVCKRLGVDPEKIGAAISKDLAQLGYPEKYEIIGMPGGASNRGYLRVKFSGKSRSPSLIVMVLRDPDFKQSVEEVLEDGFEITELPFLNVLKNFQASGVSVPRLDYYNEKTGLIYIEDLGDTLLRNAIVNSDQDHRRQWLKKAIDELVKIQVGAGMARNKNFIGFRVKFNRGLLRWELDHFKEWALDKRLGDVLSESESKMLDGAFEQITDELLASPYILSHRDYHIDNLLVRRSGFALVDFQDARWGPLGYDLASLLNDRDVHRFLALAQREALVDWFARERGLDPGALRRSYALAGLQRSLKAVGTFAYQARHRGRNHYLEFILPSLRRAARLLPKDEAFTPIAELLQEIATPASSNFLY